jgi:aminopeptidase-like protein
MSEPTAAYIPGVCNINREEIARRRTWRDIGATITVVLTAGLFIISSDRWLRLLVFLPAYVGAIGYLQTKNKFCVSYAASGLQNATEGNKKAQAVDKSARALDQAKARNMNIQAAIIALLITAVAVAI